MTDETTETEATETTEPEAVEAPDLELTVAERDAEILRWKTMIAQHMPDVDIDNEIRFVVPNKAGERIRLPAQRAVCTIGQAGEGAHGWRYSLIGQGTTQVAQGHGRQRV